MNLVGIVPRFLKAYGGWVLTALGSLGLAGTVILAAKEAPEAERQMEQANDEKHEQWMVENVYPEESLDPEDFDAQLAENLENAGPFEGLTFFEKAKVVFRNYWPAMLTGAGTLCCFWGAQIFNARAQASLVAAYGALALQFDQYREAIRAECGEDVDKRAYSASLAEAKRLKEEIKRLKEENGPFLYEFEFLPGIIFEAKPVQIEAGFAHFNRNLLIRGYGDLCELYSLSCLPDSCYDPKEAGKYGWQVDENEASFGMFYCDFYTHSVKTRFGEKVNIIRSIIPPYELGLDYGFEADVLTTTYPECNFDKACLYARSVRKEDVVRTDKDMIAYAPVIFNF